MRGVSKSIVVDLGVGIEGTQEDELPEAILCQARFDRCDLDGGAPIPAHLITPTVTATPAADTGAGAGAGKSAKSVKATGTAGGYASTKNAFVVGCAGTETPALKIQRGLAEVERMRVSIPPGPVPLPPPPVSSSTTTSSRFSRKY